MRSVLFLAFLPILLSCSDVPSSPDAPLHVIDAEASTDGASQLGETSQSDLHAELTPSDTRSPIGTPGASCKKGTDCDSGFCLDTRDGKLCSKTCSGDCPMGFECKENTGGGGDLVFVCVSRFVRLCDPCKQHSDCNAPGTAGNICISHASAGSFCGVACENSLDCPASHVCQFVKDPKTELGTPQCVPQVAQCTCSPRAILLGLSTSCSNKNFFGACSGTRTCTAQGLTGCIGQIPEDESCDGVDENCDGIVDNINPKKRYDGCQSINEFGACDGEVTGCKNGIPACNAPEPAPEACNGKDDDCDGLTDEKLCNDGNECTADTCNTDGSCKYTKLTGMGCDDQNVCTSTSQCASGVCLGAGPINCDDNDPCSTDFCDPFTGCVHKPSSSATCQDDGNECTLDVCTAGACVHPSVKDGVACATDGEVCTTDLCKSGACAHLPNMLACNDGNPCTLSDTCKDKLCSVSTPKVCLDSNPCTLDECDPKIGCVFKPTPAWQDGLPCPDDGNPCTLDECKGSTCAHVPIPNCD